MTQGVEIWRRPAPDAAKRPMYLLLNLALGPGWPIDNTPDPSRMEVNYVRVYAEDARRPAETERQSRP